MPNLDLWPLLEQLSIKPKTAKIKRLRRDDSFAWAQRQLVAEIERQYNAGEPVRIIILKGRQLGLSTITEAVLFLWAFLHEGSNGFVLSKENDDSEYLLSMTKLYWEKGPFYTLFRTKYYSAEKIEWEGINSTINISTAKKADVGRGKTLQAVHCSEVAFWERSEDMVPSLMNAIPYEHGTICILESTANGVGGYFHETWLDSCNKANDFTPLFFPWFMHEEYEIKNTHLKYSDLDDEERELLERYPDLTIPKLAWRRRKVGELPGRETQFRAEYPCSPNEAFLSTGRNVFPLEKVEDCYNADVPWTRGMLYNNNGRIDFAETRGGHFTVYHWPDPARRQQYVVAVDPTRTIDGDPCAIQVLNRATLEQVAIWHGHADPNTIGEISLAIGMFYNNALMNTEINGGGKNVLSIWRDNNYTNIWVDRRPDSFRKYKQVYGFYTTYDTKQQLLGTMIAAFQRNQTIIHHPATYHQICQYVSLGTGTYGPARRSGEDDCVMSYGIALYTALSEANNMDYLAAYGPQNQNLSVDNRQVRVPQMLNYGDTVDPLQSYHQARPNPIFADLEDY